MVVVRLRMLPSRSSVSRRSARDRSDIVDMRPSAFLAAVFSDRRAREASCAESFSARSATDAAVARAAKPSSPRPASLASSRSRLRERLTAASPVAVLLATLTLISMSLPTVVHPLWCAESFHFDQAEQFHVLFQQGAGEAVEAVTQAEDQAGTAVGIWWSDRGSIGIDTAGDCSPSGELCGKGASTVPSSR